MSVALSPKTDAAAPAPDTTPPRSAFGARFEIAGYVLVALALSALLLVHVTRVDGFYLDEWFYTQGAEYVWSHAAFWPFEEIPNWNRGPQRLYTFLLAFAWGPLSPSPAFTVSHIGNVLLLVSGIAPLALLARRIIVVPLLRVLAVALAIVIPWLVISAHQLTENLALPVYLWTFYAAVLAAERPRPMTQLSALAGVAALALCRLNLGAMFAVLLVAVLAAEVGRRRAERETPLRPWVLTAVRREAIIIAASGGALVLVALVVSGGGESLGAYGGFASSGWLDAVLGPQADDSARVALTYVRGLTTGSFVFPVMFGLAAALAGVRGRLGDHVRIPSVVLVASLGAVIGVVSVWTVNGAIEERYVFFAYPPLAIFAVAAIEQARRIIPELIVGGAAVIAAFAIGTPYPGLNSGNFFAAPGQAFWSRVVDFRVRRAEPDLLSWMPGAGRGYLLVALAMLLAVIVVVLLRRSHRVTPVLAAGLTLCLVAQAAVLNYDYGKLLDGVPEAPGGLAGSPDRSLDRDTWIDDALPDGAEAALLPGLVTRDLPYSGVDRQEMWNESLSAMMAMPFVNGPVPGVAGIPVIRSTRADGLATWNGPRFAWFVGQLDDPRAQYRGRLVARSRHTPFGLWRAPATPARAVWTAEGLDADAAVLERRPVTMTLDRAQERRTRFVSLRLQSPVDATAPIRWRIRGDDGSVRSGGIRPGKTITVRLPVQACDATCDPVSWTLRGIGTGTPTMLPVFGPPPPPRPVQLYVLAARREAR